MSPMALHAHEPNSSHNRVRPMSIPILEVGLKNPNGCVRCCFPFAGGFSKIAHNGLLFLETN